MTEADNFKAFLKAILEGKDYEKLLKLSSQVDLTRDDDRGISALHYAAESGNLAALDAILATGKVDVNKLTLLSGSTALMQAAMNGHLRAVERLLVSGADAKIISRTGYTALMMAVEAGSVECVKVLLRFESDLNTVNTNGQSICTLAIRNPVILELILASGRVHKDSAEASPLHCSNLSVPSAQLLLGSGFDVNFMDTSGDTPLDVAIKNQNLNLAEYFLQNGADLMLVNRHGESVFELAALHDESESFLRKHQCPLYFLNKVIVACAARNRLQLIKFLTASNGVDLDEFAAEAFESAAQNGALDCVSFLLPLVVDDVEILFTGAQSAIASGHMCVFTAIFAFVRENSGDECKESLQTSLPYLLLSAAECGQAEAVQFLLEQRVPVDGDGTEGCTPLIAASASGSLDCVRLLLKHGAKVNAEHECGGTALLLAATNGHFEIVKELLNYGADQSIKDSSGFTPLLTATMYNRIDIVNLLLSKAQQVNCPSNEGLSPLLAAASIGDDEVADRFLSLGAEIGQSDDQGNTALHIAAEKGHIKTVSFLIRKGFGVEPLWSMKNSENQSPLQILLNTNQVDSILQLLKEFPEISEKISQPSLQPVEGDQLCLICRDEMEGEALVLPCKHEFHASCFEEWSKLHPKCPTCKRFPYKMQ